MNLSKKQSDFLNSVLKGKSVFLTGKAGTGKSFIVKEAISILKEKGKNIVTIAPTGVAANNIGGQTIHSMFQLSPFGVLNFDECRYLRSEKRRMLDKIDVIFIDEVSMLRADLLDAINWTLIKNGIRGLDSIQIIFIGDLKQLEAPIDDNFRSVLLETYDRVEFFAAKIYKKLIIEEIELDEVHRQTDEEFINNLNIVREGGKSDYFRQFLNREIDEAIVLAPHNSTVDTYNRKGLQDLKSELVVLKATVEGNINASDFNVDSTINIKNGAKVMYLVNSKNNNLVNGTIGEFLIKEEGFFIKVGKIEYAIEQFRFTKKQYVLDHKTERLELIEVGAMSQYPIKLAYALTIHKSQGLTFERVKIDLSIPCFSKGQLYTALSRVTSPSGLSIISNRS